MSWKAWTTPSTLRTNRGHYFDSSCSGASNQSREWRLSGRSKYEKVYAVWACEGHTAGSLDVEMRRDDAEDDPPLSTASDWVRIVTPTPAPTPTVEPTPEPEPTPRPTLLPDLILPNPADGDTFNLKRPDCRDIYPSTDLSDTSYGYHGSHRYLARSSIYGGWVPKISLFMLSRHMPSILTYCSIGFGHHVTHYQGDTTLHGTMEWRIFEGRWESVSLQIGCDAGTCEWESKTNRVHLKPRIDREHGSHP